MMEATAEAFLAAAHSDAALAADKDQTSDDDRSSSLSDLEDALDSPEDQMLPVQLADAGENDSEAETERLEESPDKLIAQKKLALSPSKLGQSTTLEKDLEPETFSDSAISSPLPSDEGSLDEELEDEDAVQENGINDQEISEIHQSAKKRKRSLLSGDFIDAGEDQPRRKRTRSLKSNDDDSSEDSAEEDRARHKAHREGTADAEGEDQEHHDSDASNEDEDVPQDDAIMADVRIETSEKKVEIVRRTSRRKAGEQEDQSPPQDLDHQVEDANGSDEEDIEEGEEADDADAIAKTEEEAAKRIAAMEALTALEKHFATLRDRLYDERIASINQELAQLSSSKPSHPDLLQQIECVEKYRDDKFTVEQKLLVHRIGALKRKSVAERSQIHSAYFQTIRDVRERHLERVSEHFYRIQRDRFKTENRTPDYTIPFAEKRSVQISQQTAYNKEVSIMSGVAKYVGFPAAPELPNAQQKELENDLEKMGISAIQTRPLKQPRKIPAVGNAFASSISQPAAEEQFLEQNPWANPQHPVHRQRLQLSRQASNQSPSNESLITPAHQQRLVDTNLPAGSASTIVENASGQISSAINTPHDETETQNGVGSQPTYRLHSSSPFDTRRVNSGPPNNTGHSPQPRAAGSSPLAARVAMMGSPSRMGAIAADRIPRNDTVSPSIMGKFARDTGITTGTGLGGFGVR